MKTTTVIERTTIATLLVLAFLATAARAGAPVDWGHPELMGYQAASHFYPARAVPGKNARPRIRMVSRNAREVHFSVRPVRQLLVRGGVLDADRLPETALGAPVFSYVAKARPDLKGSWKDPATGLVHTRSGDTYRIDGEMTLPMAQEGTFLLTMTDGRNVRRFLYLVSPLGMVVKHARSQVSGFVFDQAAQKPVAGASVKVWSGQGLVWSGQTAADGTFRVQAPRPLKERITVLAMAGEHPALYTYRLYAAAETRDSVYVYTDRPLYRPGHHVYYKGIVASAGDLVAGAPVTVEIRDPSNRVLLEKSHATDGQGTFHGDALLSDEASVGDYGIVTLWKGRRYYETFTVRQYRKPSFEVHVRSSAPQALQGSVLDGVVDARYLVGQPLAGGHVSVTVTASPRAQARRPDAESGLGARASSLTGKSVEILTLADRLSPDGTFRFRIPTRRHDADMDYQVAATVQDAENRTVSGSASVFVARSEVVLAAWVERDLVMQGESAQVRVKAKDLRGQDLAVPVRLALERATFASSGAAQWSTVSSHDVTTDAKGEASWSVPVHAAGYLRVKARALDARGNATATEAFFWASGRTAGSAGLPSLEIVPDRRVYKVGDVARVLVNSALEGAWAYVSVEGTAIHDQRVLRLDGHSATLEIPVRPEYAPGFYVHVSLLHRGQYAGGSLALAVPDRSKILEVSVEPDRPVHRPGEPAMYRVRVTDASGKPVATQFSLAVVDEGVFALQADGTRDLRDFYYGRRQNEVVTGYTVPREVTGGSYQNVPSKPVVAVRVARGNFRDTAFWGPVLQTDADGMATVRLTLPDNLTRWRATVRAVAPSIRVGSAASRMLARKDLMIRLAAPRFLRETDEIEVGAQVHNLTTKSRRVNVQLSAPGVEVAGPTARAVDVRAQSIESVRWKVRAPRVPEGDRVVFTVQAEAADDAALADGETIPVPVLAYGHERVDFQAFRVQEAPGVDRFQVKGRRGRVTLRLAPSLAAAAFGGIEGLATYPYGCVEQTMSSFLPDVALAQALRRLKIESPRLKTELPRMVTQGLARLYDMQHADGGWGWWKNDESSESMTVYVLQGLTLAREAGFEVRERVLVEGHGYLLATLERMGRGSQAAPTTPAAAAQEAKRRDWEAMVLRGAVASAPAAWGAQPATYGRGQAVIDASFKRLQGSMSGLSPHGLAMLAEALLRQERRADAEAALREAWGRGRSEGPFFHWAAAEENEAWNGSSVEVTAMLLGVAARLQPKDERIPRIVAWLMQQRQGTMWTSTRTTSHVLLGLSEVVRQGRELESRYAARVSVNGREVARFSVTPQTVMAPERVITLKGAQLREGSNEVQVTLEGTGTLYVSRDARSFVPVSPSEEGPSPASAQSAGLSVRRAWQVKDAQGNWIDADGVKAGQAMRVVLEVGTTTPRQFVMLEDWFAAGFEPVNDGPLEAPCIRRDFLDDHAAFFFRELPKGTTVVTYEGRAEQSGVLHAMPARAEVMYYPSIQGETNPRVLRVTP